MKKRLVSTLLALVMACSLLPGAALAASPEYGEMPIYTGHADVDYMARELLRQIPTDGLDAVAAIRAVREWVAANLNGSGWFSQATVNAAAQQFYRQSDEALRTGLAQIRGDHDAIYSPGAPTSDANVYIAGLAQAAMLQGTADSAHSAALTAVLLGHLGYDCRVIGSGESSCLLVLVDGSYRLLNDDGSLSDLSSVEDSYALWLQAQAGEIAEQYAYACAMVSGKSWSRCSSWAEEPMRRADRLGLIPQVLAYRDLRGDISRAEFAAVAVALYEKLSGQAAQNYMTSSPFSDTDDPQVLKAYCLGVVNGMGDGTFAPDSTLTRQQAVTMLGRVYELVELGEVMDGSSLSGGSAPLFTDDGAIAGYARAYIYFFVSAGVINGMGDGTFAPTQTMSRQAALKTAAECAD